MRTSELTGAALDWAVAKCEGRGNDGTWDENFSSNWLLGGPIIEREGIAIDCVRCDWSIESWCAALVYEDVEFDGVTRAEKYGPTPLIAAMRCFVASKLGDEVEIPNELTGDNK